MSEMRKFKYAIFDFDGTIVDTETPFAGFDQQHLNTALKQIGIDKQLSWVEARALAGNSTEQKWEILGKRFGFNAKGTLDFYMKPREEKRPNLFKDHPAERAKNLELLLDTLGEHKALATNKKSAKLLPDMKIMGLNNMFNIIVPCDPPLVRKPDPGLLLTAAEKLGAAPEECAYIGDNVIDVQATLAAGMLPVSMIIEGFKDQEQRIADLKAAGSALIVEDMNDIIPYYDPS